MRRAPFVIGATVAGLGGVLAFHTHPSSSVALLGPSAGAGSSSSSHVSSPPKSGAGSPSGGHKAASPSKAKSSAQATATGKGEQYGYGTLKVSVTVSAGKIVRVSVPALQVVDQYSQQIAVQVIPMLRSQVLSAQSSRINGVSGATYTSEAYALSLQSALDKLHFA